MSSNFVDRKQYPHRKPSRSAKPVALFERYFFFFFSFGGFWTTIRLFCTPNTPGTVLA